MINFTMQYMPWAEIIFMHKHKILHSLFQVPVHGHNEKLNLFVALVGFISSTKFSCKINF
jgi:hypothetical protein